MKKIAVLGPRGTFSDSAAQAYINQVDYKITPIYFPTIDDAFHSVGNECDYGIIPIENTLDGYVQRTLDLLRETDVHIIKEVSIPVKFSLVANATKFEDVKRLYVQFKANGQCRNFIDKFQSVNIITTESNMESYYKVENKILGDGAIIPQHMLATSDAEFKLENVTDSENNFTRFIVIENFEINEINLIPNKRIRVPLYIMPETDRPGLLLEILKCFYENNINLISIMSRPTKKKIGSYNFYIEVDGDYYERDKILNTLKIIGKKYETQILGIYSK